MPFWFTRRHRRRTAKFEAGTDQGPPGWLAVRAALQPVARTVHPFRRDDVALDDEDERWIGPLLDSRPSRVAYEYAPHDEVYEGVVQQLFDHFPERTQTLLAATAAMLTLELVPLDDAVRHRRDLPGIALHMVDQWLAGHDKPDDRLELLLRIPIFTTESGTHHAIRAAADLLRSTLPPDMLDDPDGPSQPAELRTRVVVRMVLESLGDSSDHHRYERVIRRWWSACKRRLSIRDVTSADLEPGGPPDAWPGDTDEHLDRVAIWENQPASKRAATIRLHAEGKRHRFG